MKRLLKCLLVLAALPLAACSADDRAAEDRTTVARGDEVSYSLDPAPEAAQAPPVESRAYEVREGFSRGAQKQAGTATGTEQGIAVATDSAGGAPPGVDPVAPGASLTPMIIRTGTAQVRVDSLEEGIAQVRTLAQRLGGIVGNTSILAGSERERVATIELRIPAGSFERAVGGLSPIGQVESVNVTAEDVGEEYTDVSARVANARRLESRLLDLLERRTGRLEEMLAVEREVARVREEIERYEGRLRYLRTRSSVSTLTVTLAERAGGISRPGDHPIRDAFGEAVRNLVNFVAWLIAASGILIPLALLAWLLWRLRHRLPGRDEAPPQRIFRRPPSHREPAPPAEAAAVSGDEEPR